jgi:HEAT repeat protein
VILAEKIFGVVLFEPVEPDIVGMVKREDVPGLIKALEHEDMGVRMSAAGALGACRDPRARALEPLIKVLNDEQEHAMVRAAAAKSLGHGGDERALPALRQAMNDKQPNVRKEAEISVALMGKRPGIWFSERR